MLAAFQKVREWNLVEINNTKCFLDDIIIVSRRSKENYLELVFKCLKKLDEGSLRMNFPECPFAKTEIEWLKYKLLHH